MGARTPSPRRRDASPPRAPRPSRALRAFVRAVHADNIAGVVALARHDPVSLLRATAGEPLDLAAQHQASPALLASLAVALGVPLDAGTSAL